MTSSEIRYFTLSPRRKLRLNNISSESSNEPTKILVCIPYLCRADIIGNPFGSDVDIVLLIREKYLMMQ